MHTKVLRAATYSRRIRPSFWMTTEHGIDRLIPRRSQNFQQRAVVWHVSGERGVARGGMHTKVMRAAPFLRRISPTFAQMLSLRLIGTFR